MKYIITEQQQKMLEANNILLEAQITKQFKIGEEAEGGIIEVTIKGKFIQIRALDFNTKTPGKTGTATTDTMDVRHQINEFLNELTTSYHADNILKFIDQYVEKWNSSGQWLDGEPTSQRRGV